MMVRLWYIHCTPPSSCLRIQSSKGQNTVLRSVILSFCLISTPYLEKNLMELDQILHMHWCWPDLDWDCYSLIFCRFTTVMPLGYCQNLVSIQQLENELMLCSPNLGWTLGYSQNFVSTQNLVNELMEFDQILQYTLILTRSRLGLLNINFHKLTTWPLVNVRILSPLNSLWTNQWNLIKFSMPMHWPWPDLGWDCYTSLVANLQELWPLIIVRISFPQI